MSDLIFKLRGGIWTLLFVVIYFVARPSFESFCSGLILVIIGQLLRFWAVGCIGRYRGEIVGAQRLVTWGAYSLARNPLYIANALIGIGWAAMAGTTAILFFVPAFIIVYVLIIIPREEDFLREKFGLDYVMYCRNVGRFLPLRLPINWRGRYDRTILWKSERHSLFMTVLGTVLLALKI